MRLLLLAILSFIPVKGLRTVDAAEAGITSECISTIDSIMNRAVADTVFPGGVVAIVRGDMLAFLKAYGSKSVVPSMEAADDSTIYDLASLSKSTATAIAALQLADKGQLDLSAPVSRYIPGFAGYDAMVGRGSKRHRVTGTITVSHLLLHSSGLPAYASVDKIREEYGNGFNALVEYIAKDAPRGFYPGTKRRYSCLNYIILQVIVESITGERLCDYSKASIFDPLGMDDTRFLPGGAPDSLICRIAPTEASTDSTGTITGVIRGSVHDPLASEFGDGNSGNAGVFSTARDLAVLCAAILNGGCLYRQEDGYLAADKTQYCRRILSPEKNALMFKADSRTGRTYGWDSKSPASDFAGKWFGRDGMICHTGFTGPSIIIDRSSSTAIILLNNRVHPFDRSKIKRPHAMLGDVREAIADAIADSIL